MRSKSRRVGFVPYMVAIGLAVLPCAGQSEVEPVAGFLLVDSEDRIVGSVMEIRRDPFTLAGAVVFVKVTTPDLEEHFVDLVVNRDRVHGDILYFEERDCGGAPFVRSFDSDFLGLFTPHAVNEPGRTVYLAADSSRITLMPRSFRSGQTGNCQPTSSSVFAFRATPVVDLETVFTRPFRLEELPRVGEVGP